MTNKEFVIGGLSGKTIMKKGARNRYESLLIDRIDENVEWPERKVSADKLGAEGVVRLLEKAIKDGRQAEMIEKASVPILFSEKTELLQASSGKEYVTIALPKSRTEMVNPWEISINMTGVMLDIYRKIIGPELDESTMHRLINIQARQADAGVPEYEKMAVQAKMVRRAVAAIFQVKGIGWIDLAKQTGVMPLALKIMVEGPRHLPRWRVRW